MTILPALMICAILSTPLLGRLLSPLHTSLSLSLSVASLRFLRIHEHVPLDPLDDVLHEIGVEDKLQKQKQRSEYEVHHHAVHCSPAIRHGDNFGDHCVVWSPVCTLLIYSCMKPSQGPYTQT